MIPLKKSCLPSDTGGVKIIDYAYSQLEDRTEPLYD
jgi:hypothetical protein